jgi:hypothetical protein
MTSGSASLAGTTVQMGAAGGLVFNITYDSSVSNAPAGFTSAITDVVNYYESEFNDPITVNIEPPPAGGLTPPRGQRGSAPRATPRGSILLSSSPTPIALPCVSTARNTKDSPTSSMQKARKR